MRFNCSKQCPKVAGKWMLRLPLYRPELHVRRNTVRLSVSYASSGSHRHGTGARVLPFAFRSSLTILVRWEKGDRQDRMHINLAPISFAGLSGQEICWSSQESSRDVLLSWRTAGSTLCLVFLFPRLHRCVIGDRCGQSDTRQHQAFLVLLSHR